MRGIGRDVNWAGYVFLRKISNTTTRAGRCIRTACIVACPGFEDHPPTAQASQQPKKAEGGKGGRRGSSRGKGYLHLGELSESSSGAVKGERVNKPGD
jgi:hypothetical protein